MIIGRWRGRLPTSGEATFVAICSTTMRSVTHQNSINGFAAPGMSDAKSLA